MYFKICVFFPEIIQLEFFVLKRLLSELETKYKSAMIANSSMYNEKQALRYQVDSFKDILDEHYETLNQAKRQLKEKCKVLNLFKIFIFSPIMSLKNNI